MSPSRTIIPPAALAVLVLSSLFAVVPPALAEVNVNINVGPPPVVVHEPPELVVVPRTMVYFVPGVEIDLFFYRGFWWTRHGGRWYRSRAYNGPWIIVGPRHVPVEIVRLPRDYRTVYVRERRIPYGHLKKDWERRERERREMRGEWKDWKEDKHDRKEREKEWKEHNKEHKGRGKHAD